MTVCIAAIYQEDGRPGILGASDRMITVGDVEFEPPQPKVLGLTTSIVAMIAGDAGVQAEVYHAAHSEVSQRVAAATGWLTVESVAEIWADAINAHRRRHMENTLLKPLGLTLDTLIARQHEMAPGWLGNITERMTQYVPTGRTIIAGLDQSGPHLFTVNGRGQIICNDFAGFVAIGGGQWHAESQFMFAQHGRGNDITDTLLLIYSAKKRAEVAPGVGIETDMFVIPTLGGYTSVGNEDVLRLVRETYESILEDERASKQRAATAMRDSLMTMIAAGQSQTQTVPTMTVTSEPVATAETVSDAPASEPTGDDGETT